MKSWILLFVACATASYVSCVPLCGCPAMLFKSTDGGKTIDSIAAIEAEVSDEIEMETCSKKLCQEHCEDIKAQLGKFPDFNSTFEFGLERVKVGTLMCEFYNITVDSAYAGMYWQLAGDCKTEKEYTGYHSSQKLCCDSTYQHKYYPC